MTKKIVYFDMDNVLVDFPSAFDKLPPETLAEYQGRLDEVPDIFSLMAPKEGALETFKKASKFYDTYILSTAPWKNPSAWSDKLLWVQKYLGGHAHKRLILSHNKHLNAGDYLIDDRLANGADRFTGQHLHFGQVDCPNWETVEAYLHLSLIELTKQFSFDELRIAREAWMLHDPIDVIDEDNPVYWGEYDSYLERTLQSFYTGGIREVEALMRSIVHKNMCLVSIDERKLKRSLAVFSLLKGQKLTITSNSSGLI